jgi:hypothetical protein
MILETIQQLNKSGEQAVIINVGTKLVTTLALLSALRHSGMPVLVIDCESKDGSWDHFARLMETYDFDLLSAPLKPHGQTLDWLFAHITSEKVLLVDSDLELLGSDVICMARKFIDDDRVFGCGFTHGPCWLTHHVGIGFYQERIWMPLAMLKVSRIREALAAGNSLMSRVIFNDCRFSRWLSDQLGKRFQHPSRRNWRLSWLDWMKGTYYGEKPCYLFCDTGADVYQYLKYRKGLFFAGFPAEVQTYVTHYHGVTRLQLDANDTVGVRLDDIAATVEERLRDVYGFSWTAEALAPQEGALVGQAG